MRENEDFLEQAERHVLENAERIAKQKDLILELRRGGHAEMLKEAEALLRTFEDFQRVGMDHLKLERQRAAGGQQSCSAFEWQAVGQPRLNSRGRARPERWFRRLAETNFLNPSVYERQSTTFTSEKPTLPASASPQQTT